MFSVWEGGEQPGPTDKPQQFQPEPEPLVNCVNLGLGQGRPQTPRVPMNHGGKDLSGSSLSQGFSHLARQRPQVVDEGTTFAVKQAGGSLPSKLPRTKQPPLINTNY